MALSGQASKRSDENQLPFADGLKATGLWPLKVLHKQSATSRSLLRIRAKSDSVH